MKKVAEINGGATLATSPVADCSGDEESSGLYLWLELRTDFS